MSRDYISCINLQVGDIFEHKVYGAYEVISKTKGISTIRFNNTGYTCEYGSAKVVNREVRDRFYPSVVGVGYLGNPLEKSENYRSIRICWTNMLKRCYELKDKCYEDTTVCKEWLCFRDFYIWAKDRYIQGYHLDKDIKSLNGMKIYSPETCCFVKPSVNCKEVSKSNGLIFVLSTPFGPYLTERLQDLAESLNLHHLSLHKLVTGSRKTCGKCCLITVIDKREEFYANIT